MSIYYRTQGKSMSKTWRDNLWATVSEQRAKALKAHQEALQRVAREEAIKRLNDSLGQH